MFWGDVDETFLFFTKLKNPKTGSIFQFSNFPIFQFLENPPTLCCHRVAHILFYLFNTHESSFSIPNPSERTNNKNGANGTLFERAKRGERGFSTEKLQD